MAYAQGAARTAWIDALKGVGILAVVIGHIWSAEPLHRLIYIWHMPLFFLLAGYGQRRKADGAFCLQQMRSLALPWLVWSVVLFAVDHLIEGLRGVRPIYPDLMVAARALFIDANGLRGPFAILWFPPCLFVARAMYNGLLRLLPDGGDWRWGVVATACFAAGHMASVQGWSSPLGLIGFPGALGFIILGGLWKSRLNGRGSVFLWIGCAGVAFALVPAVNMKSGLLGMPVLSALGAACIVVAMARLLAIWSPPGLAMIGRLSMTMMFAHLAFVHYLGPYAERWQLAAAAIGGSILVHFLIGRWWPFRLILRGEARS